MTRAHLLICSYIETRPTPSYFMWAMNSSLPLTAHCGTKKHIHNILVRKISVISHATLLKFSGGFTICIVPFWMAHSGSQLLCVKAFCAANTKKFSLHKLSEQIQQSYQWLKGQGRRVQYDLNALLLSLRLAASLLFLEPWASLI